MSERQKAILSYLVQDVKAEIACWNKTLECFSGATTNSSLLEKLRVLEFKIHEYEKFVKNVETLFLT